MRAADTSLMGMIQSSAIAAVISNPRLHDNPIIACNAAFVGLVGYSHAEVVGRNCRFLTGPRTEPDLVDRLRHGIHAQRPTMVDILNYRKDGSAFRNAVLVAPIFDADGRLEYFLGSQSEVTEGAEATAAIRRIQAIARIDRLTPRQRDVVVRLAAGKLNKQIAYELGLNERTVKLHRAAVLRALDLRTTAEIIRLAIEAGY